MNTISLQDVLFVGFNGHVMAITKKDGRLIWSWTAPRSGGFVSLLCESGILFVSVEGLMYGLDPCTGSMLWENQLIGFGYGYASLATLRQPSNLTPNAAAAAAEDQRRKNNS